MLVPWRNRSTYLPRTPPRESYSGRRSSPESEGLLVFFIVLALAARGRSCTNDPNLITVFCMRNYQKTSCRALTQQEPSLLTDRVFWISDGDRQRIAERQGANTPLPLEQSPPVSFKRLLGGRSTGSQSNRDRTDSHHNRHGRGQQDPEHSDPAHECHQSNEEEEARASRVIAAECKLAARVAPTANNKNAIRGLRLVVAC